MIEPGTELDGKYRIIRLLGEGGMGSVYEAEHVHISRRVALKMLHPSFGRSERVLARFAGEARAAAAIGHEGIAQTLDCGTWRGLPFLVMELLRGETLADRLDRVGTLDPREACRVAGHVLSALAAAHAAGIVHRDLKPENIFLVTSGRGDDAVKLLDFGVSKFRLAERGRRPLTAEGPAVGTPGYMSPEQCMSRPDLDHRADLFSVGVTLYESLTSALPYDGHTPGEIFLEVVQGTRLPAPPSEIAPRVPRHLDALVLRALARDRDARFHSAQSFLEALRPYGADGIDVTDAPPRACEDLAWAFDPPSPTPLGLVSPMLASPAPASPTPAAPAPAAPTPAAPVDARVDPLASTDVSSALGGDPDAPFDDAQRDTLLDPPHRPTRRPLLMLGGVLTAILLLACVVRLATTRRPHAAPPVTAAPALRSPPAAPPPAETATTETAAASAEATDTATDTAAAPPATARRTREGARRAADDPARRGARRGPRRSSGALDINREF